MTYIKRCAANILLLVASLLLSATIIEVLLRTFDSTWEIQRRHFAHPGTKIQYQSLPSGLHVLKPGQSVELASSCIPSHLVNVNAYGYRGRVDRDRADIALLGDSFVEALQIPESRTVGDLLEFRTGLSVINAGVSGYATTHELLAWNERLAATKPKIVVLFVFLGNDISGNSCALSKTLLPCGIVENSSVRYLAPSNAVGAKGGSDPPPHNGASTLSFNDMRETARRNLALYALGHDLRMIARGLASVLFGKVERRWGLYQARKKREWEDAWLVTKDSLSKLKSETAAHATKLILVSVPEFIAITRDPASTVIYGSGSSFPPDFEADYPSRRLRDIAAELDLPILDMLPEFLAYRDRFSLPPPYFFFSCDGHWNPLGHALAADALASFLEDRNLVRVHGVAPRLNMTPPDEILGASLYSRIFRLP